MGFSLSAVFGGGAGLLLLPVVGSLLPGAQVPAALSIGTVSSSISRIIAFWSRIRLDVVVWFVPPALPAVWIGAKLLTYINPLYLEFMMGLFLMANLTLIFRSSKELDVIHSLPKGYLALIGLLFDRFYLRYGMAKEEIVDSAQ
nr:sulfite exporter TauE/SafE family protein [Spirosoma luteum]